MTALDFILIIPLIYYCYKGIRKGFIKRLLAVIGLILGVYVSYLYNTPIAKIITDYWDHTSVKYMSYLIPFILVVLGVNLFAHILTKSMKLMALSPINILLGAVFGLAQGALFSTLISLVLITVNSLLNNPLNHFIEESLLINYFKTPLNSLLELVAVSV